MFETVIVTAMPLWPRTTVVAVLEMASMARRAGANTVQVAGVSAPVSVVTRPDTAPVPAMAPSMVTEPRVAVLETATVKTNVLVTPAAIDVGFEPDGVTV